MTDNLAQLDQGGSNCQFTNVYLGPTLGWARVPVVPEILVTPATAYTVPSYASRILLKGAVKSVTLPSVSQWMLASLPLANTASFDRSIWIKDLGYNAGTGGAAIVITPNGTDQIDAQSSFSIITPGQLIRLYPLTDLSGWYVG